MAMQTQENLRIYYSWNKYACCGGFCIASSTKFPDVPFVSSCAGIEVMNKPWLIPRASSELSYSHSTTYPLTRAWWSLLCNCSEEHRREGLPVRAEESRQVGWGPCCWEEVALFLSHLCSYWVLKFSALNAGLLCCKIMQVNYHLIRCVRLRDGSPRAGPGPGPLGPFGPGAGQPVEALAPSWLWWLQIK